MNADFQDFKYTELSKKNIEIFGIFHIAAKKRKRVFLVPMFLRGNAYHPEVIRKAF